ncbi:hypothetical protein CEXT_348081 [Caerostris extrusa]|uniref:Uncharacterized protein n=1 Tax=Caerostris extrusa TaxID=172846 RepID=A0AAV4Y102_CAEEX|nr:hypothetical protein CEXT_348081 [Caerostris extrusa]
MPCSSTSEEFKPLILHASVRLSRTQIELVYIGLYTRTVDSIYQNERVDGTVHGSQQRVQSEGFRAAGTPEEGFRLSRHRAAEEKKVHHPSQRSEGGA